MDVYLQALSIIVASVALVNCIPV